MDQGAKKSAAYWPRRGPIAARAQRIGRRPIAGPQKRPLFDGIIAGVDERDAIRARDGAHIEANFSFLRFVLILCFDALGL